MPKQEKKSAPSADTNSEATITYVKPTTDFPFVYANNAVINFSPLDGSIIFGEVVGEDAGKTVVIPKVKVVMARPFLEQLRDLMVNNILTEEGSNVKSGS